MSFDDASRCRLRLSRCHGARRRFGAGAHNAYLLPDSAPGRLKAPGNATHDTIIDLFHRRFDVQATIEEWIVAYDECTNPLLDKACKGSIDLAYLDAQTL